ncbi:MAG: 50S ribosomal protein L6 [Candidatus Spechtbacterales bacterium]
MSRIGKQPIEIPQGVTVTIEGGTVSAKGPLGELSVEYPSDFNVRQEEQEVIVAAEHMRPGIPAQWGLYRSLIANVVNGVANGFEKRLEIQGVGYRAEMKGNDLVLNLGYSHPITITPPEGVKIQTEGNNVVVVSGADKQLVGQVAADIRATRKPEPYKGKGVRYQGEYVRSKQGKRAASGA